MNILEPLFSFRVIDVVDIILFAILLFEVYSILKGTTASKIFLGLIAIYVIWRIVRALQMPLLSAVLGQFISVGVIALIVVFQPEIRQFLLIIGNTKLIRGHRKRILFWRHSITQPINLDTDKIVKACKRMSDIRTGALIVITRKNALMDYIATGQLIDARISDMLLETIFFKNSPLHDGAVIISGNTIKAARCILPVSHKESIPRTYGLRHRAAVGITEHTDALAIIVSEETGDLAYSIEGELFTDIQPARLYDTLDQLLRQ